jgi:rhodanese-related sulfurtransferase
MSLPHISPADAELLLDKGALLVDIRDSDEHARERIASALNMPLGKICNNAIGTGHKAIVFHCRSGNRTRMNASLLAKAARVDAFILDGGIDAWKKAGLPVIKDAKQPIELMRQVQIAAGSLAFLGTVLGFTGTCAMGQILGLMPWNRVATT